MAILIFLTVLIVSLGFWTTCSKFISRSRARLLGNYVAEQVIARAMEAGYDDVGTMAGDGSYNMDVTVRGRPANYIIAYKLSVVDVNPNVKSVEVKVEWGPGQGVVIETYLSSDL